MDFKDFEVSRTYRSSEHDLVNEFYIPMLEKSTLYKRAVGYFSSSALYDVSRGLTKLVKNNGKLRLIASPALSEQDIEAIRLGYADRTRVIEDVLLSSFREPTTHFEFERLNLLAHLISEQYLDIKIAFMRDWQSIGLYHEKIGVVHDGSGNRIAFTGSLNESSNAFWGNFESIDVFASWKSADEFERVNQKERDFDGLWANNTEKIEVIEFPQVALDRLYAFRRHRADWDLDDHEFGCARESQGTYTKSKRPNLPDNVSLYDYQVQAVDEFARHGFSGIFSMATGTGKTITGLAAVTTLYHHVDRLAIVIVCPYQHLVDQWVEDVRRFGFSPIIGYATSSQRDWKKRLKESVNYLKFGVVDQFSFVTTNATYASDYVQDQISQIKDCTVIVVDEAHYFGATGMVERLNWDIAYRLALSATIDRHGDPEGTGKLRDYFGKVLIDYPLEKAIDEGKLVPYYYRPVLSCLTPEELQEFKRLSLQLSKCYVLGKDGSRRLSEPGKMIAIKRARFVAGSSAKLRGLEQEIIRHCNDSHILVYCGATTVSDVDYKEGVADREELRQIEAVTDMLGNGLGMKVAQFTSQEDAKQRSVLKREFAEGENLQALIAIRCLDEGVNVPEIRTAFILASSTNPKEYIQRRGRLLRTAPGKQFATIYDFVTLPRQLEEVRSLSSVETRYDSSLIQREIKRMSDFAELSKNPQDGFRLIQRIKDVYQDKLKEGGAV